MQINLVVDRPKEWPLHIPGVTVVDANEYLTDARYAGMRGLRVFNLCRSYRYQSRGYYVSLLASARGHKPVPSVTTLQDMKMQNIIRMVSDELDEDIQRSLSSIRSRTFTLSIYFGRNLAARHEQMSLRLFNMFQAPFLRAHFTRTDKWHLQSIGPIAAKDIPSSHRPFVVRAATRYFAGRRFTARRKAPARYSLAILHNPSASESPSNKKALTRFERAATSLGMDVEFIKRDDFSRLVEFDALFIRETTAVNHYTYRFSRRAAAEGLVVIDDPESILRCTNKVYLAELLIRLGIPGPRTVIVRDDNLMALPDMLGLPCILKQPDSAFSLGVKKVDTVEELEREGLRLLDRSELIIAQEFLPTEFDWRIGIFDRKPLYACRYFMASKHWQIVRREQDGKVVDGHVETLPVELAPRAAVRMALKAANAIGDGLYGVDVKQVGRKFYVIEVNDNPNIDAGFEDAVLKENLYSRIMEGFLARLDRQRDNSKARS